MRVNHKIFRRWENHSLGKYYLAYIARDLFGIWNVVKAWGMMGQSTGGLRSIPCRSQEEAVDLFMITHRKRLHRGYRPVCPRL